MAIDDVQVYPDVDRRLANVHVTVANVTDAAVQGTIHLTVTERKTGRKVAGTTVNVLAKPSGAKCDVALPLGEEVRLWDEFSPSLYELSVSLEVQTPSAMADRRIVTFGMRNFAVRGTQFTMNGRPVMLRGTFGMRHLSATGYPPTDVASWRRIYRIIKSYGLNYIRFHSWCPPEAAFDAADVEGVMIQAEPPLANAQDVGKQGGAASANAGDVGKDFARDEFIEEEMLRMLRTYGNHPSFCQMTLGNEYDGPAALLSGWIDMLKKEDPRHLYTSPCSNSRPSTNRQYSEACWREAFGFIRGVKGPKTDHDFRDAVVKEGVPIVGHEIGQWTFYPNFDEIKKYTGVMAAKNFELIRDDLKAKHLLDLAPRFVQATGKQAMLLYKEEIEVLLRTPGFAGFSLLDMHDFPGQGTALIGPLDPFWDSKGFVLRKPNAATAAKVPLLRMKSEPSRSTSLFRPKPRSPTSGRGLLPATAAMERQGFAGARNRFRHAGEDRSAHRQLDAARSNLSFVPESPSALQADRCRVAKGHGLQQ